MKLDDKPLILLGDNHGQWSKLLYELRLNNIKECNLISVGDIGIGFATNELENAEFLNKRFREKDINFYSIRGNHDDPSFFHAEKRIALSNFELVEDYTITEYKGKTIQCIGGAISIDRKGRAKDVSWWPNERINFEPDKCKKVDILITHTAPSWCAPTEFGEIVYGWAKEDAELIQDLVKERKIIDDIFSLCEPKQHFYGHFHFSKTEVINECKHKLLNIDELYELRL